MKPRTARKSVTDKQILNWVSKHRPFIAWVISTDSDECEIATKSGSWRRKTLRSAIRAAMSGVSE